MSIRKRHIGAACVGASLLGLAFAPSAQAYPIKLYDYTWQSHIDNGSEGFQSRRWEDSEYSEVLFGKCVGGSSVTVQMRMDVNNAPDKGYDKKTFTACYKPDWSQGEWYNLPNTSDNSSEYYFQITDIGGASSVDVTTVAVDTTACDDIC